HSKPFDLAEGRQPRRFRRVAAVAPTGRDDVDRRLLDALHGANLHRRRMGSQQKLRAEVKGIPVLTRRVAGGDVERFEVVPLGLDLGSELDLITERLEHGLDLPANLGQDVDVAAAQRRTWKSYVDRLGLGEVGHTRGVELRAPGSQRGLDVALGFVGGLAERRLLLRRKLTDVREQAADVTALAAEILGFDPLEIGGRLGLADRGQRLAGQRFGIAPAANLRRHSNRMSTAGAGAPAAAAVRRMAPALPGSCTRSSTSSGQRAARAAWIASAGGTSCTRAIAMAPCGVTVWVAARKAAGVRTTRDSVWNGS